MAAARRASSATVESMSDSRCAVGQKRGTSRIAATMSRASSAADSIPPAASRAVTSTSRAPNDAGGAASTFTEVLLVRRLLQCFDDATEVAVEDPLQVV